MKQYYDRYTVEDHKVWNILFERQLENLVDKAHVRYSNCLTTLEPVLNGGSIPDFEQLDQALLDLTGWSIEVVPGHIPVNEFFALLAQRKFPSSTWLRTMDQLDYIEEPDMFHDIFGHIPLLADPAYASFMFEFGSLGSKHRDNRHIVDSLRSLYWFTIEFGLTRTPDGRRIYGAGILSSFGESRRVMETNTEVLRFDLERILHQGFRTDSLQELYYETSSFEQFLECMQDANRLLSGTVDTQRRKSVQ